MSVKVVALRRRKCNDIWQFAVYGRDRQDINAAIVEVLQTFLLTENCL